MVCIGVDLGGTNIKAGIVSPDGKIIDKGSVPTLAQRPAADVIRDMGGLINDLLKRNRVKVEEVAGIGVGSPGAISSATGVVDYSNNLGWKVVPLAKELSAYIDRPVKVSNDANVAALGETLFGAGQTYSNTILLTLGTGVGGGIVIDNKLYEGNESKGAELGHMVVVVDGEKCTCGRPGCLEAYCSATALIRDTKRAMEGDKASAMWKFAGTPDGVDGRTAFECAKQGDASAQKVVDNYIKYLGEGMLNYANIFRPQAFMLGGGVCAQGENLVGPLKEYCKQRHYGFEGCPRFDILIASLGNDAGIIGAASLIISELKK